MQNDLTRWVHRELAESALDDDTQLIVMAALDGDAELASYLDDGTAPALPDDEADEAAVDTGGTFLSSISVEGFRGIGPAVRLALDPRPGLTIVAGRNGSGKSSISEALELLLTGDTYRWRSKSSVEWRQQWRNLHHDHAAVAVSFVEEGASPTTVRATWADGEGDVAARDVRTQRAGAKQVEGIASLGWAKALEQYRPILSYDELGGLLEGGRAQLYDALAGILGVEQLAAALKRVVARRKDLEGPAKEATARRRQLQQEAEAIDDHRAVEAARLMRKTSPDEAAVRALATGSAVPDAGPLAALRALTALAVPATTSEATERARALRAAVAALADAGADLSARSMERLEVLEAALALHTAHGDMECPVCRQGSLDAAWHATSEALAARQRTDLEQVGTARQSLALALGRARQLVTPTPSVLHTSPDPALDAVVGAAAAAWDRWAAAPSDSDAAAAEALAAHLEDAADALAPALDAVREAAAARLAELDNTWAPYASRLAAWCDAWRDCEAARPVVAQLTAAEAWLKAADLKAKNERLAPIEDGAREAWSKLRQESNVDLGALTLTGSGNQRRVRIDASVDGVGATGFTVLSQGELHALALSLFLPRATMAASPFRFLVLDDPIQAMDPAKVDGLVELLTELAETRQVIVLSHDDRLPAAVRRGGVDATVLEVSRGTGSAVTIATSTDPATRYLDDAFGLVVEAREERLTQDAMRRALPGLLRFAVEAAAKDRYFSRRLAAGDALADVEEAWERQSTTRKRVSLAVFLEEREHHELEAWAKAPYQKFALRTIGTAMHTGLKADIDAHDAARDVQKLVADLRKPA